MELLTVSLMSASDEAIGKLQQCLNEEFADLHNKKGNAMPFRFHMDKTSGQIHCFAPLPEFNLSEDGPLVYRKAASAVAKYILNELEPLLLKSIIRKQFHYEDKAEAEAVERYCRNLLYNQAMPGEDRPEIETAADKARRKMKVAEELEVFLTENSRIHLDGFVTFRLNSYWDELREVAAYAVDEYVMDKQYQEFISLLKYFVRMQEVKLPIVHVLHKGGSEFALYDEQFKLLESAPADRIVAEMLESEMNMEDMIVSTLITVSPKQIVIHTRQPELPVMRTLETIFEQRVRLCAACRHCMPYFEEPAPALPSERTRIQRILT
jgi:putative sporulation protein YtxC